MSDLISRQDAIEAIYKRIKQIGYEHNTAILSILQAVRDLPSAQPEQRKGECSYKQPCGWCSLFDTPCYEKKEANK